MSIRALGRSAHARQMLLEVADLARLASERGLVDLVQRRSEPGPFPYLAIKRRGAGCRIRIVVYLRSQVAADGSPATPHSLTIRCERRFGP